MSYYRLYFIGRRSGHFESVVEFHAADDGEAIGLAADHAGARPLELWSGSRKVQAIDARSDSLSSGTAG